MKNYFSIFIILIFNNFIIGQEKIILSETASEVHKLFSAKNDSILWKIPIGNQQYLSLFWSKKQNSFSNSGLHSFVGYEKEQFRGVISFKKTELTGVISLKNKEIKILSTPENQIIAEIINTTTGYCGNCKNNQCDLPGKIHFEPIISPFFSSAEIPKSSAFNTSVLQQISDPIIRVYRLAMPIAYNFYSDDRTFNSNTNLVEAFWASAETYLNEIYERDLSVRFEIVKDQRLISKTENDPFNLSNYKNEAQEIIKNATKNINSVIGSDKYDIGIVISKNAQLVMTQDRVGGLLGLAGIGAVYSTDWKAHSIAIPQFQTIAHEIGHMFGGKHTFARDNSEESVKTEVDSGQSVMSYGNPMNFFSLVSIVHHIKPILSRIPYYTEENQNNKIGNGFWHEGLFFDNTPRGIQTNNKAPNLLKTNIFKEYSLPTNTFFEFKLSATDPQSQPLYYMGHPANIRDGKETGKSHFLTKIATVSPTISFQTEFQEIGSFLTSENLLQEIPYSIAYETGDFTFWLGVRNTHNHDLYQNSAYDITETQVKIKPGKPFAFTNSFKKQYHGNEKIELRWETANSILPENSKVRILLSDDFGKTFKHTLINETENDGICEIVLPNIAIGTTQIPSQFATNGTVSIPAGVIKIEVINHIAYALSAIRPYSITRNKTEILGGFTIQKTNIIFKNTPNSEITIHCTDIPQRANVIAIDENTQEEIPVIFEEKNRLDGCQKHSFTRTWTATKNNITISFIQTIHTLDDTLEFTGILPKNLTINCGDILPMSPEKLSFIGGCGKTIQTFSEKTQKENCPNSYSIIREWIINDSCGKSISHIQEIKVTDTTPPVFLSKPRDTTILQEEINTYTPNEPIITDNCNEENITISFSQNKTLNAQNQVTLLTNTWSATDACGNQSIYTQQVTVLPELKIYNAVSTQNESENYFSVANLLEISPLYVSIYNDMGIKVFESKQYENPDIFKGHSNQSSVFFKNKHLPKGTYFYLIKYIGNDGKNHTKTGFLIIK